MEFSKNNIKRDTKTEKSNQNEYDFKKQEEAAIKQFEKLYLNLKDKNILNKNQIKKENSLQGKNNSLKKIKAKFKKNKPFDFTDIFFKDQDKTLIVILIVMLMDNEENIMIIMILIFLLV